MTRETEKRLIKALEFLKEPQGSTITKVVKAIQNNDPGISLKKIVQTLKGCLENGVLKVADGRVKLRQTGGLGIPKSESDKSDDGPEFFSRPRNSSQKPTSVHPMTCQGSPPPDPPPDNPDGEGDKGKCKKPKKKPKCKPKKPKCKPKKPKCKPKKPKCAPKKKPQCKKNKKCM